MPNWFIYCCVHVLFKKVSLESKYSSAYIEMLMIKPEFSHYSIFGAILINWSPQIEVEETLRNNIKINNILI